MPLSREIRIFPLKVKAHAVATSLQLFNKADLQAVMKAGRWSSGGTFYILLSGRPLAGEVFSLSVGNRNMVPPEPVLEDALPYLSIMPYSGIIQNVI